VKVYNSRAKEILKQYVTKEKNYVILDKGRNEDERSMILVENRRYVGYGYIDATCQVNEPSEFKSYITQAKYYPDSDVLLRSWLKHGKTVKKVVF